MPPTLNDDGSPLTDLTSYEIWHGCSQSGAYDTVEVVQAPANAHTATALPDIGTCYFAARATNSVGASSNFSNEASKLMAQVTIPGAVTDTFVTWQESSSLTITNTLPATYQWSVLGIGSLVHVDQAWTFSEIPPALIGLDYLQTKQGDKSNTDPNSVSFSVKGPVTILVAYDDRFTVLPTWLSSWADTGMTISRTKNSPGQRTYNIFSKDFPAGQVVLGGNESTDFGMYIVIVRAN